MQNKKSELKYEPLAIVGIGCRFPGNSSTPDAFWKMLAAGTDCIIDVPKDRWDLRRFYDENTAKPGKSHQKQGGFLSDINIKEFDPLFFGMSPREAAVLDPQQRLLLETTWEAFEDAGIVDTQFKGSNTGVFIGGFCLDNKLRQLSPYNREMIDAQTPTSSAMVMLSNRISYAFDLRGPSLTIDTACSSALIAAHYACTSIWSGESDMVITGGVNVITRPEYPITMSKGQFLSKHSRCKAFDEDAGGYVRGEGAGVIVVKPLKDAIANKDYVHALIRATGSNQDGATNGITVPNPLAQEELIRKVYKNAGINTKNIKYVEAHGTGTKAGDPVEISALNNVLAKNRKANDKLFVGSVKTNIGHLESGAGIAGIIKAAMVLNKKQIPPHLHFKKANPQINFDKLVLKVPTRLEHLPGQKTLASVNSFGYGGTNGHIVLEEPPREYLNQLTQNGYESLRETLLFPISAKSDTSLKALCTKYADYLKNNDVSIYNFAYTLAKKRSHLNLRLSIIANTKSELIEKLEAFAQGEMPEGVNANPKTENPKIVYVFTGMGPQWWAMGKELYQKEPIYRKVIDECDNIFTKIAGWSLKKEMMADEAASRMNETQIAQPANFFVQAGLLKLWEHFGISPDAVVGHSVGEVPAAYAAGTMSLEDAVLVSYHRSRCQQKTAGNGTMLAIGLGEEAANKFLKDNAIKNVDVAAINSFNGVTLAGEEASLDKAAILLEKKNVFNRKLQVEVAYHSYQMDPLKDELIESLEKITAKKSKIPLYSTVKGNRVNGKEFGTDYWWQNVRQPVRFAKAAESIVKDGYTLFLEVGPHPVLRTSISECLSNAGVEGHTMASLRTKENETNTLLDNLGALFTLGANVNWDVFTPKGHFLKIPTYAWNKDLCWQESEKAAEDKLGVSGHVFMNENLRTSNHAWEVEVNPHLLPWLNDHQIQKMTVIPGAAYVEAALALHEKIHDSQPCTLQNLEFSQMLVADPNKVQMLHTCLTDKQNQFAVYSRVKEEGQYGQYTLHASGKMMQQAIESEPAPLNIHHLKKNCKTKVDVKKLYASLNDRGLNYGPYFQSMQSILKGKNEVLVSLKMADNLIENTDNYLLHPTILDAGFQCMVSIIDENSNSKTPFVPVSIEEVSFYTSPTQTCYAHVTITENTNNTIKGNLTLADEAGNILSQLTGITCQAVTGETKATEDDITKNLYGWQWQKKQVDNKGALNTNYLIFGEESELTLSLVTKLKSLGIDPSLVIKGNEFSKIDENLYQLNPQKENDFQRLFKDIKNIETVVYLWPQSVQSGILESHAVILDVLMPYIYLAKTLGAIKSKQNIQLKVITKHAQSTTEKDKPAVLSAGPVHNLSHLVGNEIPHIIPQSIDYSEDVIADTIVDEILSANKDETVALRKNIRFTKSLQHHPLSDAEDVPTTQISTEEPVELVPGKSGSIDALHYINTERIAPKDDEIELKTHASFLNLKDLLKAIGQLSQKAIKGTFFGNTFGMDASGIVARVGKNVKNIKVGDRMVVTCPHGSFKSYITFKPTYYVPCPKNVELDSLNIVPSLTILYGLRDRARLEKGEKILIHNATGGVGLVAIQWAKYVGAEIYATAGTEEKRNYLKELGIKHIYHSRDLNFIHQIKKDTDGYGVDVVINAIAGEALYQSFNLLAPYGRFVEIGKRDISDNNGLPMAAFNKNISFHGVDVDRLLVEREALVKNIFRDIGKYFEKGVFASDKKYIFKADEAKEAFSFLAQSKHMGKVILKFNDEKVTVPVKQEKYNIEKNGTYIITGGTGGFGLQVAKWLSEKGVKQLVLASRSGLKTDEAKNTVEAIQKNGTNVWAQPFDISNLKTVQKVVNEIKDIMPPLKGIVHGAVVLDDGLLSNMQRENFETSFNAKVQGAINLHIATEKLPLDFFVSFSSISSIIGNAGQANYVAANGFLDNLAHYRRTRGLQATTINLGVLGEVGLAARDKNVAALLESAGIKGFTNQQALDSLDFIIKNRPVQVGLFDVDWPKWAAANQKSASSSLFASLVKVRGGETASGKLNKVATVLSLMPEENRLVFLEDAMAEELAKVLKLSVDKIDKTTGINQLGIDSLMAVEFGRAIQTRFGTEVSSMELLAGPNVKQLSAGILAKIEETDLLKENVDDLTEEEIDALLTEVNGKQ